MNTHYRHTSSLKQGQRILVRRLMIKGCCIQPYHGNLHATQLQVTDALVPITRIGGSDNYGNRVPPKMKRIHCKCFLEFWPQTSSNNSEQLKHMLHLTIPTI